MASPAKLGKHGIPPAGAQLSLVFATTALGGFGRLGGLAANPPDHRQGGQRVGPPPAQQAFSSSPASRVTER